MTEGKGSFLNFNVFLALIILIPALMLLVRYIDDISTVCGSAKDTVFFAIIAGCMVVLSLMMLIKEMLVIE